MKKLMLNEKGVAFQQMIRDRVLFGCEDGKARGRSLSPQRRKELEARSPGSTCTVKTKKGEPRYYRRSSATMRQRGEAKAKEQGREVVDRDKVKLVGRPLSPTSVMETVKKHGLGALAFTVSNDGRVLAYRRKKPLTLEDVRPQKKESGGKSNEPLTQEQVVTATRDAINQVMNGPEGERGFGSFGELYKAAKGKNPSYTREQMKKELLRLKESGEISLYAINSIEDSMDPESAIENPLGGHVDFFRPNWNFEAEGQSSPASREELGLKTFNPDITKGSEKQIKWAKDLIKAYSDSFNTNSDIQRIVDKIHETRDQRFVKLYNSTIEDINNSSSIAKKLIDGRWDKDSIAKEFYSRFMDKANDILESDQASSAPKAEKIGNSFDERNLGNLDHSINMLKSEWSPNKADWAVANAVKESGGNGLLRNIYDHVRYVDTNATEEDVKAALKRGAEKGLWNYEKRGLGGAVNGMSDRIKNMSQDNYFKNAFIKTKRDQLLELGYDRDKANRNSGFDPRLDPNDPEFKKRH